MTDTFSHIDSAGHAQMVDVGDKQISQRRAVARSYVTMAEPTLAMIVEGSHSKGDVLAVARIAGIQAAKKTSEWIPLCHPLLLTYIAVDLSPEPDRLRVKIEATAALAGQTGVEMEALTAASAAALTLYDMCKAVDKAMIIGPTFLLKKSGGKSGDWTNDNAPDET